MPTGWQNKGRNHCKGSHYPCVIYDNFLMSIAATPISRPPTIDRHLRPLKAPPLLRRYFPGRTHVRFYFPRHFRIEWRRLCQLTLTRTKESEELRAVFLAGNGHGNGKWRTAKAKRFLACLSKCYY